MSNSSTSESPQDPVQAAQQLLEIERVRLVGKKEVTSHQNLEISSQLTQAEESIEQAMNIKRLVTKNIKQHAPEDIEKVFDDYSQGLAKIAHLKTKQEVLHTQGTEIENSLANLNAELELLQNRSAVQLETNNSHLRAQQSFQVVEEERMRIARGMHDGPAQSMSNLVLQVEVLERLIERGDPAQVKLEFQGFKKSVKNALSETRQLIFDLRPMTLDDLGIVPTLRKYTKEYSDKHNLVIHFNVEGAERRLPPELEGNIFRIVQEALNNIQKHAHARTAEVNFQLGTDNILISIKDDGEGFDNDHIQEEGAQKRLGLISMQERSQVHHGNMQVRSLPGKGSDIRITIPVPPEK
jgi:two-component system sensor histidine kinase DegS